MEMRRIPSPRVLNLWVQSWKTWASTELQDHCNHCCWQRIVEESGKYRWEDNYKSFSFLCWVQLFLSLLRTEREEMNVALILCSATQSSEATLSRGVQCLVKRIVVPKYQIWIWNKQIQNLKSQREIQREKGGEYGLHEIPNTLQFTMAPGSHRTLQDLTMVEHGELTLILLSEF